jgi:thioredoxin-related protein
MRILAGLVALALMLAPARAAELVMFEQRGCAWCQRFDREIAPAYEKTTEGKRAPLRRVDIAKPLPADLAFIERERFTPVFVLVDKGREIGRIRGYPGDAFFYGLLANLIAQMERGETTVPDPNAPPPPGATLAE